MSPRAYNLGKRQAQISQGRRQVLAAARALLGETTSYAGFTIDAVAKQADVARATVYYQFGSKTALLEAVCDDLAEAGGMAELPQVFTEPDPGRAWRSFVIAFGRFWDADRSAMRRLRSLAALDPEVGEVITARDRRRRQAIEVLAGRLCPAGDAAAAGGTPAGTVSGAPAAAASGGGSGAAMGETLVRRLYTLTSFETFDTLAAPSQSLTDVATEVVELTEAVLGRTAAAARPGAESRLGTPQSGTLPSGTLQSSSPRSGTMQLAGAPRGGRRRPGSGA